MKWLLTQEKLGNNLGILTIAHFGNVKSHFPATQNLVFLVILDNGRNVILTCNGVRYCERQDKYIIRVSEHAWLSQNHKDQHPVAEYRHHAHGAIEGAQVRRVYVKCLLTSAVVTRVTGGWCGGVCHFH